MSGRRGGRELADYPSVLVGNLHRDVRPDDLDDVFYRYGYACRNGFG